MRTEQLLTAGGASTTLLLGVDTTATRIRLTREAIQAMPKIPVGSYVRLKLGSGFAFEMVKAIAVVDQELVVERGQFGTAAASHSAGAAVEFVTPDTEPAVLVANTAIGYRVETIEVSELVTVAAAASTNMTLQIPAGCRGLNAAVSVEVQPPGTSTISVGIGGATTRFANGISTAADTQAITWDTSAYASATTIVLTPNTSPSTNAGRVRVALTLLRCIPPTS